MARLRLSGWGISDQDMSLEPHRLSSPLVFFWSQLIFLIIAGFLAAILYRQISDAFFANPGLNGLILFVLAVGVFLVFNQVLRLRPEVRWINSFLQGGERMRNVREPTLLAPMRVLLGRKQEMSLSTASLRSILDSIATRLDESRDTSRYLIGLLVFLGLLGTFWGLLQTIGSINTVIQSLDPGTGDTNDVLAALKEGLSAPLDGMGTAFSSSLFGLAGSLVLGFLDLQAGRAQNRFYTELENWLSTVTDPDFDAVAHEAAGGGESAEDIRRLSETVQHMAKTGGGMSQRSTAAMANLAEGIQGLVKNMRGEQQMLRDWIESQQSESRAMRETLEKLSERIAALGSGKDKGDRQTMALARNRRANMDYWPGFVDALSTLLLAIMFLLTVFVLAQFLLSREISGRDEVLNRLNSQINELTQMLSLERSSKQDLEDALANLQASLTEAEGERSRLQSLLARGAGASDLAKEEIGELSESLDTERQISQRALAQVELLNQQIAALRRQIGALEDALEVSETKDRESQVKIADLGRRLNVALAQRVQELNRYRSDFFGRLREILSDRENIRIVGDRFVFQSEVLFESGSADLNEAGQEELLKLATALRDLVREIPSDINWVLRVDGHTDNVPLSGTGRYADNWELSSARATSVVKYLIEEGVPTNRLVAAGFAEFQPIAEGDSQEARATNRRIELKLTER